MAVRPSWRGNLRLALVSCPIRLTPATTYKEKIRFHKLNRETGNRLRQQMIDPETGDAVASDETVMGYEFEKGKYATVEKEEIEQLKIESSDTVKIEKVVAASAVDWLYWDTPYLVEPDGKSGADIFATVREALADKDMVGLGRMVIARRERPVMIQPRGKGMLIVTLRDPDEVKRPEAIFDEDIKPVKVDKEALSMAETLLERMEGDFDLSMFEDRYQDALRALVEAKMKGKKVVASEAPERASNVVDLFGALKASVEQAGAGKGRNSRKSSPTKRHSARANRSRPKARKRA